MVLLQIEYTNDMERFPKAVEKELLHCKICECRFSSMQVPKCLTLCSHTFCVVCINRNAVPTPQFGQGTSFTCPECKTVCQLPHGNGEFLPSNLTVLRLVQVITSDVKENTRPERPPPYNPTFYLPEASTEPNDKDEKPATAQDPSQPMSSPPARPDPPKLTKFSPKRNTQKTANNDKPPIPPIRTVFKPGKRAAPPPPIPENSMALHTASVPNIASDAPATPNGEAGQTARRVTFNPLTESLRRVNTAPTSMGARPKTLQVGKYFSPQHANQRSASLSPTSRRQSAPSVLQSPPLPPPRHDIGTTAPLFRFSFGKWSKNAMETSTFREPTCVAVSNLGTVAVVDSLGLTVQIFTNKGKYLSMFRVIGINSICFTAEERLVLGTHRGIKMCDLSGNDTAKELKIGKVVCVCVYKFGFIAAIANSIFVYNHLAKLQKTITNVSQKKNRVKLVNIQDVTVKVSHQLAIYDNGADKVYITDDEGVIKLTIDIQFALANLQCSNSCNIVAIAVDRMDNIYLADSHNHRIIKLNSKGMDSKSLLQFKGRGKMQSLSPRGLAISELGEMIISLTAFEQAQISTYQIQ